MKARWGLFQRLGIVAGTIGCLVISLAADAAQANTAAAYQLQPLVKLGDQVGGFTLGPSKAGFVVAGLNDQGQVLFMAGTDAAQSDLLAEYSGGALVPVALPGQQGPGGQWPGHIGFALPISMNQRGSVVFSAGNSQNHASIGVFRWQGDSRQTTPVAAPGTPAGNGLTFMPGGVPTAAINDSDEVAFTQNVKNAVGERLGLGAFFLGRDGVMHTVVLPGEKLPDGRTAQTAYIRGLNNAGLVAFGAFPTTSGDYLWENGTTTRIGPKIVGGGEIGKNAAWTVTHLNNHDDTVLVAARRSGSGPFGLYRWAAGQLTPVLEHGQALPGGGSFTDMDLNSAFLMGINNAGQYAFTCTLTEGGLTHRGAYLLNPDGTTALILKEGMTTNLGTVTRLATGLLAGIGLNDQGQVALPVRIDNGAPQIVLLTPAAP